MFVMGLNLLAFAAAQNPAGHDGHHRPPVGQARQAEVAQKGAAVMPFDLDRSRHLFEKRPWGGVQTVLSRDGHAKQVALIRAHLRTEAQQFSRGRFDDPAAIHGADMPGLKRL